MPQLVLSNATGSVRVTGSAPAAPTSPVATATGTTTVTFSWLASVGATSYRVARSDDGGDSYDTLGGVSASAYLDTGLAPGSTYRYRVTAVNVWGENSPATSNLVTTDSSTTPPVANFTGDSLSGEAPHTATFTYTGTGGAPATYLWDFGDGQTSTAASPTHTYTSPGTYTVSLDVGNAGGSDNETKTDYVTATGVADSNPTPDPPWEAWASAGDASALVSWWASPDPDIDSYKVYKGTSDNFAVDGTSLVHTTASGAVRSYEVTGLANAAAYYFKVVASAAGVDSTPTLARNWPEITSACTPQAGRPTVAQAIPDLAYWWELNESSTGALAVPRLDSHVTSKSLTEDAGSLVPSTAGPSGDTAADCTTAGLRFGTGLTGEVGDSSLCVFLLGKFTGSNLSVYPLARSGSLMSYAVDRDDTNVLRFRYGDRTGTLTTVNLTGAPSSSEWRLLAVQFAKGSGDSGTASIRVVKADGTVLSGSGSYTRGPMSEANAVYVGARSSATSPMKGALALAGMCRGTLTDAQLQWIANSGAGRAYSAIRALPPQDPGATSPVSVPKDHGVLLDGTVTAHSGLYFLRPYPLYQWDAAKAAARGRYIWVHSSDHNNGTNGGVWVGYSNDTGVAPTSWVKRIPYTGSTAGRAYEGLETPHLIYVAGDARPFRCYAHAPVTGTFVGGLDSGSQLKQETQLFTTADPDGAWTYEGPSITLALRNTYANKQTDWTHTGYARVYPPNTLPGVTTEYHAYHNGTDNYLLTYLLTASATGLTFAIAADAEPLDGFTPFHPYYASAASNWYQNIIVIGSTCYGVGRGRWVDDSRTQRSAVCLYELAESGGQWRRPTGRVWVLQGGTGAGDTIGFIQDVCAYQEDGILHVYPKYGQAVLLSGYDLVRYVTCIYDADTAAGARPVGTRVYDGGAFPIVQVRDALPHHNYRVYRKTGAGAYLLRGTMPTTPVGTSFEFEDTTAVGGTAYTYKVTTVNGASEIDGAEVTFTA